MEVDVTAPDEKDRLDKKLDEALEETFPASDPVALTPGRDEQKVAADEPKGHGRGKAAGT